MDQKTKQVWQRDRKVTGLGLLILPSGVRTWYLRYREPDGRQRMHRIGRANVFNLTQAREIAIEILAAAGRGESPTTDRELKRNSLTVAELHELMRKRHYHRLRPNTVSLYERAWKLHTLPRIGRERVAGLSTMQVMKMLDGVPPIMANRTLRVLRKAMNLAEAWGYRAKGTNPCTGIEMNPERTRRRYLDRNEKARLLAALDQFATSELRWRFVQMIRLLMLTGCRRDEIMRAQWSWLEEPLLIVPPEYHKTGSDGAPRRVHLPPQALEILAQLKARTNSRWVIFGLWEDAPLVGYWLLWRELLSNAQIEDLRVHDLRHNFASAGVSAGLSLTQIGQLLGHASHSSTARYAHLVDEAAGIAAAQVATQLGRV
jgi:integrase